MAEVLVAISDTLMVKHARYEGIVGLKASLSTSQTTCTTRPDAVVTRAEWCTVAKWFPFPSQVIRQAGKTNFQVPRPREMKPQPLKVVSNSWG